MANLRSQGANLRSQGVNSHSQEVCRMSVCRALVLRAAASGGGESEAVSYGWSFACDRMLVVSM
eukprot:6533389-Pyramimonas_sp.AAC.1